jgi:hypothetical protein
MRLFPRNIAAPPPSKYKLYHETVDCNRRHERIYHMPRQTHGTRTKKKASANYANYVDSTEEEEKKFYHKGTQRKKEKKFPTNLPKNTNTDEDGERRIYH